jgi:3-mercaptopyruvate sulfurtransferase SseA
VVRELRRAGWKHAQALKGGWEAWRESGMPIDPVGPDAPVIDIAASSRDR